VRNIFRRIFPSDSHHFSKFMHTQSLHPDAKLPLPGLMSYPSLKRGLASRVSDEISLNSLSEKMKVAVEANDRDLIGTLAKLICTIAYGKGTTPDGRRLHLEKYGCAKHTPLIMGAIAGLANERLGLIEMGCGNGQWSRILADDYKVDVIAFDNMSAVPLNLSLYHNRTQPSADYFYSKIIQGSHKVFYDRKAQESLKGRVLLVVFPDPGRMAMQSLLGYTDVDDDNDTFVYVGEGRGGANGDNALFDELESGRWRLLMVENVEGYGTKGLEKMFVFKRWRAKSNNDNNR
jgi:hypothetical protein